MTSQHASTTTMTHKQPGLGSFVQDHPVVSYFLLAYALSWIVWLVAIVNSENMLGQVALYAGVFGPAVAAVIWC